jgi:gamma-carbonic anhydrase
MLVEHRGRAPSVDSTAYVAPTAVLGDDVRVGPDARMLFGAVITAEDGSVELGARCVIMENALLRGRASHPVTVGDDVLIGPAREASPRERMERQASWFAAHRDDRVVEP